jgi:hypothetical protein
MHYTDGRVYTGEWMNGAWHGKGTALFSNHDTYTGDYQRDQRHGVGVYQWNDGRVYQGGFVNDQRHGLGEFAKPKQNQGGQGSIINSHRYDTSLDRRVYVARWGQV